MAKYINPVTEDYNCTKCALMTPNMVCDDNGNYVNETMVCSHFTREAWQKRALTGADKEIDDFV